MISNENAWISKNNRNKIQKSIGMKLTNAAYRRNDNVYVAPITFLKD